MKIKYEEIILKLTPIPDNLNDAISKFGYKVKIGRFGKLRLIKI